MSIFNTDWQSGDQITRTKLANMVSDEVNQIDDIHPQYNKPLVDLSVFFTTHVNPVAGNTTYELHFGPPNMGIGDYSLNTSETELINTDPAADAIDRVANSTQFVKGTISQISSSVWAKGTATGGGTINIAWRIAYFPTATNVLTNILAGGNVSITSDDTWRKYTLASETLPGPVDADLIMVYIIHRTDVTGGGTNTSQIVSKRMETYIEGY